nr:hypothetical protein [Sphingobium sp. B2]
MRDAIIVKLCAEHVSAPDISAMPNAIMLVVDAGTPAQIAQCAVLGVAIVVTGLSPLKRLSAAESG